MASENTGRKVKPCQPSCKHQATRRDRIWPRTAGHVPPPQRDTSWPSSLDKPPSRWELGLQCGSHKAPAITSHFSPQRGWNYSSHKRKLAPQKQEREPHCPCRTWACIGAAWHVWVSSHKGEEPGFSLVPNPNSASQTEGRGGTRGEGSQASKPQSRKGRGATESAWLSEKKPKPSSAESAGTGGGRGLTHGRSKDLGPTTKLPPPFQCSQGLPPITDFHCWWAGVTAFHPKHITTPSSFLLFLRSTEHVFQAVVNMLQKNPEIYSLSVK